MAYKLTVGQTSSALAITLFSLASTYSNAALAQTPAPATSGTVELEEIIVTGFRAALRSALVEKRNSTEQVDAINAEDIADFPDNNLAESLQRLPGVSIDRDNGEGRSITVRGLGGDFNRTRLNGLEALSTAGANEAGGTPNRSRSFDYSTFASELFSSLKVQKSPSAETDEGSLGATIDLQTGRPFDYRRNTYALSTEGSYNENSKKVNPRTAGLISHLFNDKKMGILISGAYSKSYNELDQYRRSPGAVDYTYRGTTWAGNENPQRAGFAAPTGTSFGTAITNPEAIALLTGSDPTAYAKLYPGAPFNTPGRFDDSLVRIPALPSIEQQNVKQERLGLTAAYQWEVTDRTRLSIDGAYSRLDNLSAYNQVSSVGLNRNNTNATYNTAANNLTPVAARALYPGLCTPNAGTDFVAAQDCGQQIYGSTPAFNTAMSSSGTPVAAILGSASVVPGSTSATNANIFSVNPFNLDPYDYYNNPNSIGYIPSSNRLAFRGALIGRPAVEVVDANVTNGLADYLVLRNVDFRSAVDQNHYVTKFQQGSFQIDHAFADDFTMRIISGMSESRNTSQGLLVEFNRMDSQGLFVQDSRGGGNMPIFDLGFDAANPSNWEVVKGFSAIRHFQRSVKNTYKQGKIDFDWQLAEELSLGFGANYREFSFSTQTFARANDLLNPTLKEAGVTSASMSKLIEFGQGLKVPEGTTTSFVVPDIAAFDKLFDFTCNCVNKWGDWRINSKANGGRENYTVTERDTGYYVQGDWDMELFGNPFRGNVGTRVAITEVDALGNTTAGRTVRGTNRYTDILPSLNMVYEPIDDVLLRFGASKVMARPLLGNLSPIVSSLSIPNTGATEGATLTVGNPKLKPFRSDNFDASVEWYFQDGGLISVAGFRKDIGSFPQTVLYSGKLSEFLDEQGIAAVRDGLTNAAQLAYLDGNYDFTARQFRDAPGGWLKGFEVSFQMDFTFLPTFFSDFGTQLNYTHIDSKLNYILDPGTATVAATTATGPFLNVSPDAFNATLYYEGEKFRARVSVAQRKGYSTTYPLAAGSCAPGLQSLPATPAIAGTPCDSPLINDFIFSKSTTNIDASVSYKLTKEITVTAEGLNLINQTNNRLVYRGQNAAQNYSSSGRIFRIGTRFRL
jgi:iron complex outermembrane receptor protein